MDTTAEQITHLEQIIDTLRRRQRVLEIQRAGYGPLAVPSHIELELQDITRDLSRNETELRRLRPNAPSDITPYLGLLTFQESDATRFFGRDALIATMLEKVRKSPFLAVLGPSGSGKSSVVRAGLIPQLRAGALPSSERWLYCPALRPGPRPLNSLAAALINMPNGAALGNLFDLQERLATREDALLIAADGLRNGNPDVRLVMLIDQAEELWTFAPTNAAMHATFVTQQQGPFLQQIISATQTPDSPLVLLFALRADFLHRAAEHPALAYVIGEHDLIVSPMTNDELRAAIVLPANSASSSFEAGLIEKLIEQTANRPGALPLLEYTLLELWKRKRADGTLTWEAYEELGGVEGALAARADAILAEHYSTPELQQRLRKLLVQLVQPGEGAVDTRRRIRLTDLTPADSEPAAVQTLLKPLADERLLTTGYDPDSKAETVELAHEALIRAWPTFNAWINAAREDLRFQIQLDDAAREWEGSGESTDFLWSGLRLANAEAYIERVKPRFNERDQRFLDASRELRRARQQAEETAQREREALLEARLAAAAQAQAQASAGEALFDLSRGNVDRAMLLALGAARRNLAPFPILVARAIRRVFEDTLPNRRLLGHTGDVLAVSWSPGGLYALSGSRDGTVRIWNPLTGALLHSIDTQLGEVSMVDWSPDGNRILIAHINGMVRIWDVQQGQQTHIFRVSGGDLRAVASSPDAQYILTRIARGPAIIWEVATGKSVRTLAGPEADIRAVAWSPSGEQILTGGYDGTVILWGTATNQQLSRLRQHKGKALVVGWSPSGHEALSGGEDSHVYIYDVATGEVRQTLEGRGDYIASAAWHPDGDHVLIAGDMTARVWNVRTGQLTQVLEGHMDFIRSVDWSPDGRQAISCGRDGAVRIWEVAASQQPQVLIGHTHNVRAVDWSPDGRYALTGSHDKTARIWDVANSELVQTLEGHAANIQSVAWNSDGRYVLTGGDRTARIWDARTGKLVRILEGHTAAVVCVAWSADDKYILTGAEDRLAHVYESATGDLVRTLKGHTYQVFAVAWSPDAARVLTGSRDGTARIWNWRSGECLSVLQGHTDWIRAVAWSPDGRHILTGSRDRSLRIWDAETGQQIRLLLGHSGLVSSVAWSPDGRFILTSGDRTARVWEMQSGRPIDILESHRSIVRAGAWSPDGQQVITGSDDRTARIWLVDTHLIIAELTRRLCNLFTDDEIRAEIPSWRGCEAELAAVKDDLAEYDRLRPLRP
jgi:WD40 repeat protein